MVKRVPNALMPHRARIAPHLGDRPDGDAWGEDGPQLRCQWAPASQDRYVSLDGADYRVAGRIFLDEEPQLRARVRVNIRPGIDLWVVGTKLWDNPRVARFAEVALTEAPLTPPTP